MATSLRNTLAENLGGPAQKLATHQFSLEDVPDLSGKNAVVTGGSQGIGYGCTHTLLTHNVAKLFIVSTTETIAEDAIKAISDELGHARANRVVFIPCDLSDWKSIEQAAENIKTQADDAGISILINNAAKGIMTPDLKSYGVDVHMAINHFGHVLLTSYLLPALKEAAKQDVARIVCLSSNLHEQAKSTSFKDIAEINHDYGPQIQYSNSKLANLLYARYLARHLSSSNILSNATHPGVVNTKQTLKDIHEPYPLLGYGMSVVAKPFKKDQFEGCLSTMFAATKTTDSGAYICPPATPEPGSQHSNDSHKGEQLMSMTREVFRDNGIEVPSFY